MNKDQTREIPLGSLHLGASNPLFLIAGPCVIESEAHACAMAEKVVRIAHDCAIPYIFKASYDKANRSSVKGFRGPGIKEGLRILAKIKKELNVPVLSDIHEPTQAAAAAEVCDILQIPAFLSRQTDLLVAAAKTGRIINVKKAQFLSPWDMRNVVEKISQRRKRKNYLDRARRFLRLQQSGRGHARVSSDAEIRLSSRVRRDSFPPASRRSRRLQRRPAGIYRNSGPRGSRRWR